MVYEIRKGPDGTVVTHLPDEEEERPMRYVYFTYLLYAVLAESRDVEPNVLDLSEENLLDVWTVDKSAQLPVKDDLMVINNEPWIVGSRMWAGESVLYIDMRPGPGHKRW